MSGDSYEADYERGRAHAYFDWSNGTPADDDRLFSIGMDAPLGYLAGYGEAHDRYQTYGDPDDPWRSGPGGPA